METAEGLTCTIARNRWRVARFSPRNARLSLFPPTLVPAAPPLPISLLLLLPALWRSPPSPAATNPSTLRLQ
eukprot:2608199-Pyramimonas_sp.AAC.1